MQERGGGACRVHTGHDGGGRSDSCPVKSFTYVLYQLAIDVAKRPQRPSTLLAWTATVMLMFLLQEKPPSLRFTD